MDIVKQGNLDAVKIFLFNADINTLNKALQTAILYKHEDIVLYLLSQGADINNHNIWYGWKSVANNGWLSMIKLHFPDYSNECYYFSISCVMSGAAESGHISIVEYILNTYDKKNHRFIYDI